jgi:hypothetical protein
VRRLVIAAVLSITGLADAAPPASLLGSKCTKAGTSELLAVWPIAKTKYFLMLAVFPGDTDSGFDNGSTRLSVGQIVVPGADLAGPYEPSHAIVASARAILASCKQLKVDVPPRAAPQNPTWTFLDGKGKQLELWDIEEVVTTLSMPGAKGKRCFAALARGRWCPDRDGFWIGDGARLVRHVLPGGKGSEREVIDKKWVGKSPNGQLFD